MDRIKSYDDDDMNNFAFEKADEEAESDEELLNDWSTEGPDEEPSPIEENVEPTEGDAAEIEPETNLFPDESPKENAEDKSDGSDDDEGVW